MLDVRGASEAADTGTERECLDAAARLDSPFFSKFRENKNGSDRPHKESEGGQGIGESCLTGSRRRDAVETLAFSKSEKKAARIGLSRLYPSQFR